MDPSSLVEQVLLLQAALLLEQLRRGLSPLQLGQLQVVPIWEELASVLLWEPQALAGMQRLAIMELL